MEFVQRKIKREREGFGPCARQITKECKAMLRNKIEQINLFNSTLSSNKFRDHACFYCTQKGHVAKSCPTKLSDERLYAQAGSTTFKHGDEATRGRIKKNKKTIKCFKCHGTGHFANACPQDDAETRKRDSSRHTIIARTKRLYETLENGPNNSKKYGLDMSSIKHTSDPRHKMGPNMFIDITIRVTNVSSLINLRVAFHAINDGRLPLAPLVYTLGRPSMTTSSTNNSVFRGFFEKQKLTGPNFIDWYRQLRIVLSIKDKLNYLEQPIPHVPVARAGQQVAPEILAAHSA
nr:zinc finger, CCHC-type [Tanacetum cinerariifolium]